MNDPVKGAMSPANGMETRKSEKELAKLPTGGHPSNNKSDGGGGMKNTSAEGAVGNNAGLGDAMRHLHKHHSEKGVWKPGQHKVR